MKAEDLMVGDKVFLFGDKPVKVDCIGNVEVYLSDENGIDWRVTYEHIKPIPLTPEILEKNADGGWYNYQSDPKGRSIYHFKTNLEDVAIYVEWEKIVPSPYIEIYGLGTFFRGYIATIHELQHALRMCGIKLEIKI